MNNKEQLVGVYKGDTFGNLMRKMSNDRMGYDWKYRISVRESFLKRKGKPFYENLTLQTGEKTKSGKMIYRCTGCGDVTPSPSKSHHCPVRE